GLELAALVEVERNLPRRNPRVTHLAFDAQSARGDLEHVLHRLGAQLHRLGHAGEPEAGADDIGPGRQHDGGSGSLVLLDQAGNAVGLGAIDPPLEPAVDHRQIAGEARPKRALSASAPCPGGTIGAAWTCTPALPAGASDWSDGVRGVTVGAMLPLGGMRLCAGPGGTDGTSAGGRGTASGALLLLK